jgi:hypothetical protein
MAAGASEMIYRFLTTTFVFCVSGLPVAMADVEEEEGEDRYERCIQLRSVRSTDIVNDNMIVFRTTRGDAYLNEFTRTCTGLSRDRRFTYDLHMQRLCAGDHIRVLVDMGVSMHEGRSCRLSEFRLLSEREIEEIYPTRIQVLETEEVPPSEVEEMDKD